MFGLMLVLVLFFLLIINFAVCGFWLWLSCKWCRAPRSTSSDPSVTRGRVGISYRRALAVVLLITVINVVIGGADWLLLRSALGDLPCLVLAEILVQWLVIPLVCIRLAVRPTLGKAILISLLWSGLMATYTVAFVFTVRGALTEAFVVPTGGMAETFYGSHKMVPCPQCGFEFPVNCSVETDPGFGPPALVTGCTCPNCRDEIDFRNERLSPEVTTGDHLLVAKGLLHAQLPPQRLDVVAFYYPVWAAQGKSMTYLGRLIGLPGESVAIHAGRLYYLPADASPRYEESTVPQNDLWAREYLHADDPRTIEMFRAGKFQIIRKPPALLLRLAHLVFDNDHQPKDLAGKVPSRWAPEHDDGAWTPDDAKVPRAFRHSPEAQGAMSWLRYRHLLPGRDRLSARPELITDLGGYNTWKTAQSRHLLPAENWVGDLILECDVEVRQPQGELVLELSKGIDRFQARWELSSGICTLARATGTKEEMLQSQATSVQKAGRYRLRFANVDERLTVWVDETLPFGAGVVYASPEKTGPNESDLQPARIGIRGGGVGVSRLRLWRDTYFTIGDDPFGGGAREPIDFGQPDTWEKLRNLPVKTYYVQPGHYFCLGDNSPESADSRLWGAVPERLVLGKALLKYYPFSRAGLLP